MTFSYRTARALRRSLALIAVASGLVATSGIAHAQSAASEGAPSQGSTGWYVEPYVGLNVTTLEGNPAFRDRLPGEGRNDIYTTGTGVGPRLGAGIGRQLSGAFALELDLGYDSRHASNSGTTIDTCGTSLIDVERSYAVGIDYFSLGVRGRLALGPVFVIAGPNVAFSIAQSVDETVSLDTNCRYYYGSTSTSVVHGELFDARGAVRVSVTLGLGAMIEVAPGIAIAPRVGYDIGLAGGYAGRGAYEFRKPGTASQRYFDGEFNEDLRLEAMHASIGLWIALSKGLRQETGL
ncbi:MAG TPA: hypothetical protein VNA88_15150 [Candidatus Kapabacteria bacterium]|nr:hypothetical protein [Candidatus Kapabacteria bacterium]